MSVDLETPLGFATFLACSTNFKKIYISGTNNIASMLTQIPLQHSTWMVCDEDLYSFKVPESHRDLAKGIKNVLVNGKAQHTELFKNAKA
jgi:hypothetical protein